jgi:hypothetical protein
MRRQSGRGGRGGIGILTNRRIQTEKSREMVQMPGSAGPFRLDQTIGELGEILFPLCLSAESNTGYFLASSLDSL